MAVDTTALKSSVSGLLNDQNTVRELEADAKAAGLSAQGYSAEASAYGTGGDIATQNASLTDMAGKISEYQQNRELLGTLGSQRAAVASAGFTQSGSNLDILRASHQQGYLAKQLIGTQTMLTKGGYMEQAAAARGEQTAAQFASQAALDAQTERAAAATSAKTSTTLESASLKGYLAQNPDIANTPEGKIALAQLSGDPASAIASLTSSPGWYKDTTAAGGFSYDIAASIARAGSLFGGSGPKLGSPDSPVHIGGAISL
jgi:hypothetical protein